MNIRNFARVSLWQLCYLSRGDLRLGLPYDIGFISLDDITVKGIPSDVKVIINAGKSRTAWSGDHLLADEVAQEKIRVFVARGG